MEKSIVVVCKPVLLLWSVSLFVTFNIIKMTYPEMVAGNEALMVPLNIAVPSICNFLFMALLVSIFVLIWWFGAGNGYRFQRIFIPYGYGIAGFILCFDMVVRSRKRI